MKLVTKALVFALAALITPFAVAGRIVGEKLLFSITERDVHIDKPLSNMAVEAFDASVDLVAASLFPVIPVEKQSDKYFTIDKAEFLRISKTLRAPGTTPLQVDFKVSSDAYFCNNYALETMIPKEQVANADNAIRVRDRKVRNLLGHLQRDRENRAATLVSTGNVGASAAFTNTNSVFKVSNLSGDIISAVNTAHATIQQRTGIIANTMVLEYNVSQLLRRNALVLDMFKYNRSGLLSLPELASVFGVERILVSRAIKNVGKSGQTASLQSIWGNKILLAYVDQNPGGPETATYGASFRWTDPEIGEAFAVQRWDDPHVSAKREFASAGYYQDEKIIAADLGYLMTDVL
jgi:hypothetical protein